MDTWRKDNEELFDSAHNLFMRYGDEDSRWSALYYQQQELLDSIRTIEERQKYIYDVVNYLVEAIHSVEDDILVRR